MSLHIHFLDPYQEGSSPVHRLDARIKLVLTVAFVLTSALTPFGVWPVYLLLLSLVLSAALLSEIGIGFVLKRALLSLPFILAALPLLFTTAGPSLASFPLGFVTLTITQTGLERFLSIAFRSWVSVQAAILLASTTTFPDLLVAMRALRLPRLLVAIIGLMWRYLFVIADEALRLMRARAARSGDNGQPGTRVGGTIAWRAHVTGGMLGNLLLRSLDRSDRIYNAMVSRGYDGEVRTLPLPAISLLNWLILGIGLLLLLGLLALSFLFLG